VATGLLYPVVFLGTVLIERKFVGGISNSDLLLMLALPN